VGFRNKKAFTLIELLVVIAIIALLLSILMPALTKVKKQAQAAVCLANIKQWGSIFTMYAQDNNESFVQIIGRPEDPDSKLSSEDAYWCAATLPYYQNADLRFCPSAKRDKDIPEEGTSDALGQGYGKTFENWGKFLEAPNPFIWWDDFPEGSYGLSEWCANPRVDMWGAPKELTWGKFTNVDRAGEVPLFMDCKMVDTYPGYPGSNGMEPPPYADQDIDDGSHFWDYRDFGYQMICMDRHSGGINVVFVDGSARKVKLKELWALKWHKNYNTANEYTQAGYVWPNWMK